MAGYRHESGSWVQCVAGCISQMHPTFKAARHLVSLSKMDWQRFDPEALQRMTFDPTFNPLQLRDLKGLYFDQNDQQLLVLWDEAMRHELSEGTDNLEFSHPVVTENELLFQNPYMYGFASA